VEDGEGAAFGEGPSRRGEFGRVVCVELGEDRVGATGGENDEESVGIGVLMIIIAMYHNLIITI
jgi:hypothetical protein